MPEQLSFDLPAKTVLGRDDFFVAPSNALAVALIDAPQNWPDHKLVLYGPKGAGKTHLAHVWAGQTGATLVQADTMADADIPTLAQGAVVVEDVPEIAQHNAAQVALFHLHNLLRAAGHPLLMTGQLPPNLWDMSLPDLQSRINGAQSIALEAPDDTLLAAILAKLFADRQITPRPDVIPYLVTRMDRDFAAAARIVAGLDRAALAEKRDISRALAVRLLDSL